MEKTLDAIYRRLVRIQSEPLVAGLRSGKAGLLLFMALYSEWKNHGRARSVSARLLAEVTHEAYSLPTRLVDGSWGILWTLQYLCDKGILETDDVIQRMLHQLTFTCRTFHMAVPVRVIPEDGVFSEGICTLAQWKDEDILERYVTEERLIGLVDECERLLTMEIPGIHRPKDMPISLLHSIVWYLQEMVRLKLYPYRAEQLLAIAAGLYPALTDTDAADRYVLTSLLSEVETIYPEKCANETFCHILGKVGFYSLLYNRPELFRQIWKPVPLSDSLSVETLCGLGYGILQCKMNAYG